MRNNLIKLTGAALILCLCIYSINNAETTSQFIANILTDGLQALYIKLSSNLPQIDIVIP